MFRLYSNVRVILAWWFWGWIYHGVCWVAGIKGEAALWTPKLPISYCGECRREIVLDSKFCSYCGVRQWPDTSQLMESTVKRASLLKSTSK